MILFISLCKRLTKFVSLAIIIKNSFLMCYRYTPLAHEWRTAILQMTAASRKHTQCRLDGINFSRNVADRKWTPTVNSNKEQTGSIVFHRLFLASQAFIHLAVCVYNRTPSLDSLSGLVITSSKSSSNVAKDNSARHRQGPQPLGFRYGCTEREGG